MSSSEVSQALLPSISLALLSHDSPERTETARKLLHAFERDGFLYLTDYTDVVPEDLIQNVFAQSAEFFRRPQNDKDGLEWSGPKANRGYSKPGQEKTSRAMDKADVANDRLAEGEDLRESLDIGREGEDGCPNLWPQEGDKGTVPFKGVMQDMFLRCKTIHQILMSGIATALGLQGDFFNQFTRTGDNTLRLLHYPPVPPGGFEGGRRVRAGAHSDYGSLTLLFQDAAGGLQVEPPSQGAWLDVTPRKGSIIVNAGDLLARWSNDQIRSTIHRVVEPPSRSSQGGHPSRYSVAYFCNPDFDRLIEGLPGTYEPGARKYEAVNSGQYLYQRLAATY